MRLIDADDVLCFIEDEIEESNDEKADAEARNNDNDLSYNCGEIHEARRIKRRILESPAIDAVPVVRCKDCAYRGSHDLCPMCVRVYQLDESGYLDCTVDDGFCHCGAKMDAKGDEESE